MPDSRRAGVSRRGFLVGAAGAALSPLLQRPTGAAAHQPETLYNGIRLAAPWPPIRRAFPAEPVVPPYLRDRPAVVPIDVGRQLFVDDFLIEETALTRVFHQPAYHPGNPILFPQTRWEKYDEYAERTKTRSNPTAMPFSDGVFFDPDERIFKMWYMGGYSQNTCYATSPDGISWERPSLDVVAGTNIVTKGNRDSSTVWLDTTDRDRTRRYKLAKWHDHYLELAASADGVHWRSMGRTGFTGDRSTFFYNPFRGVWVYSLRDQLDNGRFRTYWETPDLFSNVSWRRDEPVRWVAGDAHDPRRPEFNIPVEIYNLDCVAYESVLLGLFTMFRGERTEREKPNDVCVGFSRDGFHWDRPDRRAFLGVSERVGDWNWANVQSAGGCCLVVADKLYFYVSARQGVPGTSYPGICSTGLATLRRDGFASMDSMPAASVQRIRPAAEPGTLTTRPVVFSGRHLFVNADTGPSELRAEVLDVEGRTIPQFSKSRCNPVRGDTTHARVEWQGGGDLSALRGEPVRFRFHVPGGRLFAFWVSKSTSAASGGYVAAGGPGFSGPRDDR